MPTRRLAADENFNGRILRALVRRIAQKTTEPGELNRLVVYLPL